MLGVQIEKLGQPIETEDVIYWIDEHLQDPGIDVKDEDYLFLSELRQSLDWSIPLTNEQRKWLSVHLLMELRLQVEDRVKEYTDSL